MAKCIFLVFIISVCFSTEEQFAYNLIGKIWHLFFHDNCFSKDVSKVSLYQRFHCFLSTQQTIYPELLIDQHWQAHGNVPIHALNTNKNILLPPKDRDQIGVNDIYFSTYVSLSLFLFHFYFKDPWLNLYQGLWYEVMPEATSKKGFSSITLLKSHLWKCGLGSKPKLILEIVLWYFTPPGTMIIL